MWARFKASKVVKDGDIQDREAVRNGSSSLNEEYRSAFRTKSYADFLTKAQLLITSKPSFCTGNISEVLLEPAQEAISAILENTIFSKKAELKALINKYFDISAESSKICSRLLTSISQVQSNYKFIQSALDVIVDYSPEQFKLAMSSLQSFNLLSNPFSISNNQCDFKLTQDSYASVLNHLKSKRKKVAKKIKLIKCCKQASGICVTVACGAAAVLALVVAAHTVVGLLMSPAILSMHSVGLKNKKQMKYFPFFGSSTTSGFSLRKLGIQLDVAAKGAYIINRDFDTMSRLVARIHDEIEHSKSIIRFCLERKEDKYPLQEVVKELRKSDLGFRKKVEELEDHVYLCLVTINRARVLVMNEMTAAS